MSMLVYCHYSAARLLKFDFAIFFLLTREQLSIQLPLPDAAWTGVMTCREQRSVCVLADINAALREFSK
jgi:hypothetical protein